MSKKIPSQIRKAFLLDVRSVRSFVVINEENSFSNHATTLYIFILYWINVFYASGDSLTVCLLWLLSWNTPAKLRVELKVLYASIFDTRLIVCLSFVFAITYTTIPSFTVWVSDLGDTTRFHYQWRSCSRCIARLLCIM